MCSPVNKRFLFQTNSTHAIYSNSLFIYPPNNGYLVLPVVIPFSCAYPLETSTSLEAALTPLQLWVLFFSSTATAPLTEETLWRDKAHA